MFRFYQNYKKFPKWENIFLAREGTVSGSEHIVGKMYGRPELFAWIFAGIGFLMALSTLTNSRLSSRYGARRTLRWLLVMYTTVAALLPACAFAFGNPPEMAFSLIVVAILMGINLAIEPSSSALPMEPVGDMAGMASSIYGTCFFFCWSISRIADQ